MTSMWVGRAWLVRSENSTPNSLSWLLPPWCSSAPQVLPPLQGNRSLSKEAQGSHYITRQAGWGTADITASPRPGPVGPLPSTCLTAPDLLI